MLFGARECGLEARIVAERVEERIAAEQGNVRQPLLHGALNSRSASVGSRRNGSTASRTSVGWRTGRVAVSDVASTARSSLASSAALAGRRSRCFSSARAKERGL